MVTWLSKLLTVPLMKPPSTSKSPDLVCAVGPTLIGASQPGVPEGQLGGVPAGGGVHVLEALAVSASEKSASPTSPAFTN